VRRHFRQQDVPKAADVVPKCLLLLHKQQNVVTSLILKIIWRPWLLALLPMGGRSYWARRGGRPTFWPPWVTAIWGPPSFDLP